MDCEQEWKAAAEFREDLHREALEKVRRVYPDAETVADPYPVDAFFEQHWDYPGAWYTYVAIPEGFKSRAAFVEFLVRQTLAQELSRQESAFRIRKASGAEMLALWGYPDLEKASPTARFFYRNLETGNAVFWAMEYQGAIIGELYGFFELEDRDFADGTNTAYLCAFRIIERFRGQGLGSRLMETVLAELKERGFRGATIGVGRDEIRNRRLYHRLGFDRKIKDCYTDPCRMDEAMHPAADPGFWLLYKPLRERGET